MVAWGDGFESRTVVCVGRITVKMHQVRRGSLHTQEHHAFSEILFSSSKILANIELVLTPGPKLRGGSYTIRLHPYDPYPSCFEPINPTDSLLK